ncbi:MAG: BMP family ABC transporter substrate-binding protein [Peptostreptococcaceae bacterium]
MKKFLAVALVSLVGITGVGCSSDNTSSTSDTKIALVTDTLGSEEFLLQAYDEFMELSDDGNAYLATSVECADDSAWAEKSRSAAVQGYDLIVGIGWKAAGVFEELVSEFPNTKFAVIDTVSSNEEIKSIAYNTSDGAYVMGALIGNAFPDQKTFGYIGNFQNQANFEYRYGFIEGLKSVTPDAEVIVNFADTFSDTSAVYSLAKQQQAAGAKFIMGSVSSSANEGLYQAALDLADEGKEIYTSGLSVDQTREENPYIIGGLTKDTGAATNEIITEFLSGELEGGTEVIGFKEDAFGVVHVNTGDVNFVNEEIITEEVLEKVNIIVEDIKNGNIVIDVPIEN